MSYDYKLKSFYRVKADKEYPWPCAALPKRTMEIYTSDVLTKLENGTFMKHTGLGTFGHVIPMEDVELVDDGVVLHVGSMFAS